MSAVGCWICDQSACARQGLQVRHLDANWLTFISLLLLTLSSCNKWAAQYEQDKNTLEPVWSDFTIMTTV